MHEYTIFFSFIVIGITRGIIVAARSSSGASGSSSLNGLGSLRLDLRSRLLGRFDISFEIFSLRSLRSSFRVEEVVLSVLRVSLSQILVGNHIASTINSVDLLISRVGSEGVGEAKLGLGRSRLGGSGASGVRNRNEGLSRGRDVAGSRDDGVFVGVLGGDGVAVVLGDGDLEDRIQEEPRRAEPYRRGPCSRRGNTREGPRRA